jgi:hypothetical protein
LCRGNYYGIGNKKRIRFIQPESIEDRVIPWAAELEFCAPKGVHAEQVNRNRTRTGAKRWKPRPDKSRSGKPGSVSQLRIGPAHTKAFGTFHDGQSRIGAEEQMN